MNILIASTDNAVFRIIESYVTGAGHQMVRDGTTSVDQIVKKYGEFDYLILNQTTSFNRRVINSINDKRRIIDLSLSKSQMKGYAGQFISAAVLLTPPDQANSSECRIILAGDISLKDSASILKEVMGIVDPESVSAEKLDEIVTELLVKPYIMALLSRKISDLDYENPSGEYRMVQDLARIITNYNIDQIRDLLRNNPNTGKIIASFEENVKRVWNELSNY